MKSAAERLNEAIEKASKDTESQEKSEEDGPDNNEKPKGDEEEMKIDKSKLTDAERAFWTASRSVMAQRISLQAALPWWHPQRKYRRRLL